MSIIDNVSSRVLYQQDNVKAILLSSLELVYCNITIYDYKTIQILKQRQTQTLKNKSSTNVIKLRQIINIDLNLRYTVQFIQNDITLNDKSKNYSFELNFIITNLQNNQRYSFYLTNIQCRSQKIKKSLSSVSWLYQHVWDKYQIVHQIMDKSLIQSEKEARFFILKDTQTFKNYFVKIYKRSSFIKTCQRRLNIQALIHEVNFQNLIRHRHIMRYSSFMEDGEYFFLFYEQKPIKLLSQYLYQSKQLSSNKARSVLRQLLKVIEVLSEQKILHNNIKASSIFVIQNNDGWKVCLGEFQYACKGTQTAIQYKSERHKNKCHLAPQLLQGNQFYGQFNQFNSDIFSLSLLFHELLFQKPLDSQSSFLTKNQNPMINFQVKDFHLLSNHCLDLFKQMIEFDPNFRITPKQALDHQFFILHQNFTDSTIHRSYSFNTLKSYDTSVQKNPHKETQIENKRVRNRYYQTLPIKKFLPPQDTKLKTQKTQKRVKINEDEEILSSKLIKDKFIEAIINEVEMDDSHCKLIPRDVRTMKPALAFRYLS